MWCVPTVLVYALRDDQVLVMHREQEPNAGLWVAPGGKIEPGESPYETALREFAEETGFEADALQLRGVCTLVPFLKQQPWFLFVYVTATFRGTLNPGSEAGELTWVSLSEYLAELPKPEADAVFAPRVLTMTEGVFQAKFAYDAENRLVEWVEY
jgi:8-oxo-dGTP pyrophosphatase MutT (NUDIX family)